MLAHPVTVAADVHDVTVVQVAVDQGGGHGVVAEDLPPLLDPLGASQDGGGLLVATTHELESEVGAGPGNGDVADFFDHHQAGEDQRPEAPGQLDGLLRFLQGGDQVRQDEVIRATARLCGSDRKADRQVGFPAPGRP